MVLEDPPGGGLRPAEEMARGVELDGELVRTDRDRLLRRSAAEHPGWAPPDVEQDVEGIARAQVAAVAAGVRGGLRDADLTPLVAAAPVPVLVIAAADTGERFGDGPGGSALGEPTRAAVRAALPAGALRRAARRALPAPGPAGPVAGGGHRLRRRGAAAHRAGALTSRVREQAALTGRVRRRSPPRRRSPSR